MNLKAKKDRLAKATDGKWWRYLNVVLTDGFVICTVNSEKHTPEKVHEANADFITHAPTDISELIERVEELEAEARCPCGGRLAGSGYYKGDAIFTCQECDSDLKIRKETWDALCGRSIKGEKP